MLRDSGRRPDVVLASSSSDAFILIELTVPWEDRIEASNVLKTEKYSGLAKDLEGSVFRVKLMPIEVGVRGLVGKSAYTFVTPVAYELTVATCTSDSLLAWNFIFNFPLFEPHAWRIIIIVGCTYIGQHIESRE